MKVDFGAGLILRAGLLMVPLVIVFASLQTIVCGLRQVLPRGADLHVAADHAADAPVDDPDGEPDEGELWMYTVPLLSQNVLIMSLARGETVALVDFALSFGASLVLAAALVWIAVRIYHREQLAVSA